MLTWTIRHVSRRGNPNARKVRPTLKASEPVPGRYPCKLLEPMSPELEENFRLDAQGPLRWRGRWIHISFALRAEVVQVMWKDDVYFGSLLLRTFDEKHLGLEIPRRKRRRETCRESCWAESVGTLCACTTVRCGW